MEKSGRCVVLTKLLEHLAGAELAAVVQERAFRHLEAPVERVTGFDTAYPPAKLERFGCHPSTASSTRSFVFWSN